MSHKNTSPDSNQHPLHKHMKSLHQMTEIPVDRMLGTTTAIALKALSEAILHPRKAIPLIDHYDAPVGHRLLARMTEELIYKTNLVGLRVGSTLRDVSTREYFVVFE